MTVLKERDETTLDTTMSLRVEAPASRHTTSLIVTAVAEAGAVVTGLGMTPATNARITVDLTCDTADDAHGRRVVAALDSLEAVRVSTVSDATFSRHLRGKIDVRSKNPVVTRRDLSQVYTPGVARVCEAIAKDTDEARRWTIKRNAVAVVTDGTAVLGLGDIGPTAALPVMEGKAALFEQLGGVTAWPVCLDTTDTEEIISIVKALAPVYGGINLEDISAPRCFQIEQRLRAELDIPVFHDDQHGTAVVVLAALLNALTVVGKQLADTRITVLGTGAAGSAIIRLLLAEGARDVIGFDRHGALHPGRTELDGDRRWLAENTNPGGFTGNLQDGLVGSDVFIGVSAGNILRGEDLAVMNDRAIVFALANPVPEVDPLDAAEYAAVVATGRSDHPNQINNVLAFPGLFRGLLDCGAERITDQMLRAAATAIAGVISAEELNETYIIPDVFDPQVADSVADAVRITARQERRPDDPVQDLVPGR